ncbi:hypothetical protein F4820DRAFT_376303 [Hypoxylon rubiginosum]|uniref:Uncharacterized protein n=1 Tax=Hypoxylon rubiginosum TaxID=110542 RepID=A0ACB9YWV5_9PEZI|nr:hypothetical protein F4820DRAFT_376303 [Hypoxylon rubiginosum]
MDAHAILTAQGWRGKGHTLHPTSDTHGLTHHLLIKRNDDGSGLGHKKAEQKAEAWWLNAFDQALKGIDTKSGTMKQTLKGGALEKITSKGIGKYTGTRGLYSSFVRGGVMEGTVGPNVVSGLPTPPDSGVGTPAAAASGDEEKQVGKESKEERRARREAKRLRKAEKQRARKEAEERAAAKKVEKKKTKKAERQQIKATETKEERRERRDARRKRKEEKRRVRTKSGG